MLSGWILLHKKFLEWEWYDDHSACRLFIHLLLKANHKDNVWRGVLIKRGERATSLRNLAKETGLTLKQIRLSLDKLRGAQQTAQRTAHKGAQSFSIITICNYEEYQQVGAHSGAQRTAQRRAPNEISKEVKKEEKIYKKEKSPADIMRDFVGHGESYKKYVDEYGQTLIDEFYDYWTEPNKSGTKVKWELQKTFDLSRRLKRWGRNNFNNSKAEGDTPIERDWHKLSESAFAEKYGEGDINRGNDIWLSTAKKLGKL